MISHNQHSETIQKQQAAMNLSLFIGCCMLVLKWLAYYLTGSVVIFSDAMETVVHIIAVGVAWYSLRVSVMPPDKDHHFGHDKVAYLSAGLEGALILVAAFVIIITAIDKILHGFTLESVSLGAILTAAAGAINALLGWYLVKVGKKEHSILVEANGKHILTDAWTSVGAVVGLILAAVSGWSVLDPIFALLFGANIIVEAVKLLRSSVDGLMDKTNPALEHIAHEILQQYCLEHDISFHRLRLRETGQRIYADFHIVFPDGTPIEVAHAKATTLENEIRNAMPRQTEVMSHLESRYLPPNHSEDKEYL